MACCPVAALGGVFVGVLSLARIRRSSGVLRGQPTAWIGIALSAFVGVSSMLVADRLQSAQSANGLSDIRCAVEQTLGGRVDASAWWVSDARAGLADFQREASVLLAPAKVAAATQTGTLVGSPPCRALSPCYSNAIGGGHRIGRGAVDHGLEHLACGTAPSQHRDRPASGSCNGGTDRVRRACRQRALSLR
jgi:hypothetical protein